MRPPSGDSPRAVQSQTVVDRVALFDSGDRHQISQSENVGPIEDGPEGVSNFGVVSPEVWRGGRPSAEGMRALVQRGMRSLIDLEEKDRSGEVPPGVRYIHLPVPEDECDRVDVDKVLAAIEECPKPVFIHCHEGRDRTGLAVAAYRLWRGMSVADACIELRRFHVHKQWRKAIIRRIQAFAGELTDNTETQTVAAGDAR